MSYEQLVKETKAIHSDAVKLCKETGVYLDQAIMIILGLRIEEAVKASKGNGYSKGKPNYLNASEKITRQAPDLPAVKSANNN